MKSQVIILIVVLFGGILMTNGCETAKNENSARSLYKNDEARNIAYSSYDKTMQLWNIEYGEDWVRTDYGQTHIITAGPKDAKPVFLIPGLFADATMWYANANELSGSYRVYAVDLPVYGGKSEPSENKINDISDYKKWFTTLLKHYGYQQVTIGGLSYGSWLSLALAREIPESISTVIMLDPSETFTKMRSSMVWKGFRYFMFFPNRTKYKKFFDWMGGGYSDPKSDIWLEHMLDVIEYGSVGMMDIPQHRIYLPEELSMVTMPVMVLIGGKPIIYIDPLAFTEAAANALPHAEIEIIANTGHSLNVEKPDEVNRRILRFLADNYR